MPNYDLPRVVLQWTRLKTTEPADPDYRVVAVLDEDDGSTRYAIEARQTDAMDMPRWVAVDSDRYDLYRDLVDSLLLHLDKTGGFPNG
jgi:hypothetical protein